MATHYSHNTCRNPLNALVSETQWRQIATSLRLSTREFQIVRGVIAGNKEGAVARTLGISQHTVHTHVKRLYRKLDVCDRAELIVRVFGAYITLNTSTDDQLHVPE